MPATTGYQAGVDTSSFALSSAQETAWGELPAVQFQGMRSTGENLTGSKTRARPSEMNASGEVSAAITNQEQAGGTVNFGLSFGTFDEWLAGVLGGDWQAPQAISGAAGDITLTAGPPVVLSTTTAGKFDNLNPGQWIRLLGFQNAKNNAPWRIVDKPDATHLRLVGPSTATTETPAAAAAKIRASTLVNGTVFKSFYVQKKFAPGLWFRYPGSFISGASLSGGVGQFLQGSFTLLSKEELDATADASTGPVKPAPGGRVHDPVGGFRGVLLNEALIPAVVDSFGLQVQRQNSTLQFGMGSAAAQGVTPGLVLTSGTLKLYFKDFALYQRYRAELLGSLSVHTADAAGNLYAITLESAALMNPKIVAGGPNQPVMAEYEIEGNPLDAGGTMRIDRLPAA